MGMMMVLTKKTGGDTPTAVTGTMSLALDCLAVQMNRLSLCARSVKCARSKHVHHHNFGHYGFVQNQNLNELHFQFPSHFELQYFKHD